MKNTILALAILIGTGLSSGKADTFGTGSNQFTIDFTTIGNPGNAADTTGFGSVGYTYRIGTYTISQRQIDSATASGLQNVSAGGWSGNQPAVHMSWFESAAFVNWLNTSSGHQAAYNLQYSGGSYSMTLWQSGQSGYDPSNPFRNSNAYYFMPSEDEWYKAAYGKSDGNGYYTYPTGSDSAPTAVSSGTSPGTAVYSNQSLGKGPASVFEAGGLSSYGTMGQGGNVSQWMEGRWGLRYRGGDWYRGDLYLQSAWRSGSGIPLWDANEGVGFRVASVADVVPEPSTYALFALGGGLLFVAKRRRFPTRS